VAKGRRAKIGGLRNPRKRKHAGGKGLKIGPCARDAIE
jgi:hypothetical protein